MDSVRQRQGADAVFQITSGGFIAPHQGRKMTDFIQEELISLKARRRL
jgi:ATP-dependent RNA circularization protein (DNA/RNA ligase family)